MDHNAVMIAVFGLAVSVIGWFIRHEHQRNERIIADIMSEMTKLATSFGEMRGRLDELTKLIDHVPDMKRFFGPHGGQARLWSRIDHDVEQLRQREHHLINKLAIVKGSMERAGLKCGAPDVQWAMPEWKTYKPDMERP